MLKTRLNTPSTSGASAPVASRRTLLKAGVAATAASLLPACATVKTDETRSDVLVLGGGIGGLHAARMLQKAGLSVTVLEGSGRIGGRCWTARDVVGRPELGAATIGHAYGRVRANASELGVALVDPSAGAVGETSLPQTAVSLGGAPPTNEPWATAAINQLGPDEKRFTPLQLYSHYINDRTPITSLTDWLDPSFASLDAMSLRQYFKGRGASPEALRLMNVGISAYDLDDANALDFLRKNYYYNWDGRGGKSSVVRDGTSALTDAMSASLTKPPLLQKAVTRIRATKEGVTVDCADGSRHSARFAITTIPLSVMKNLVIEAPASAQQRDAWRAMRYVQLTQVYLQVLDPFWKRDGLPASLWSDGPIERVIHVPSATEPNGLLLAYINGAASTPLGRLSQEAVGQFVVDHLVRLRPAAKGSVAVARVFDWSTYPYAKGHVAYYAPGDIGRYAAVIGEPAGALYFAGEHCGKLSAGMEAACESAEAAVLRILDAVG